MELTGKRALVTGAGGGLGRIIVARLRAGGVRVAGADRAGAEVDADAVLPGDLTCPDYCNGLPAQAAAALGGIDILVNCAGVIHRGRAETATDDDLRLSLAVNVEAPFRLSRAALPFLRRDAARGQDGGQDGGAIVNIASCWGLRPGPDHPIYCMTKAALAALTECMGRDHAGEGVRINAVCPNEIDTPMIRSGFAIRGLDPDAAIAELDRSVPIGRIAQPEDIADIVLFLCSDAARYLCGALIEAHGGKPVG